MAERGELPEGLNYPDVPHVCKTSRLIYLGKLTEHGKEKLSAHRYDTCHEKTKDEKEMWAMAVPFNDWDKMRARVEKLEKIVESNPKVDEVKHDCSCKQCNKPPEKNWHIMRWFSGKRKWESVLSFSTPQEAAEVIMDYPAELTDLMIEYKKQT